MRSLGDFIDLFMAMMVMKTALKVSPGKDRDKLKSVMVMNIIVDFAIGLIPFLGDIADTFFRCNTRNAVALEKMLNNRMKASEKRAAAHGDSGRIHEISSDDEGEPPAYDIATDRSPGRLALSLSDLQKQSRARGAAGDGSGVRTRQTWKGVKAPLRLSRRGAETVATYAAWTFCTVHNSTCSVACLSEALWN